MGTISGAGRGATNFGEPYWLCGCYLLCYWSEIDHHQSRFKNWGGRVLYGAEATGHEEDDVVVVVVIVEAADPRRVRRAGLSKRGHGKDYAEQDQGHEPAQSHGCTISALGRAHQAHGTDQSYRDAQHTEAMTPCGRSRLPAHRQ